MLQNRSFLACTEKISLLLRGNFKEGTYSEGGAIVRAEKDEKGVKDNDKYSYI